MISINASYTNLVNQRTLAATTNNLQKATKRLATGAKINSAVDNAAGLYLGTTVQSNISTLNVLQKEISNGINFAATADSGLAQIQNLLNTSKNLLLSAASSTMSASARQAIQENLNSIKKEITHIKDGTTFMGTACYYELPMTEAFERTEEVVAEPESIEPAIMFMSTPRLMTARALMRAPASIPAQTQTVSGNGQAYIEELGLTITNNSASSQTLTYYVDDSGNITFGDDSSSQNFSVSMSFTMSSLGISSSNTSADVQIDGVTYTVSNSYNANNELRWTKDLSDGKLTLHGAYFNITCQDDVSHYLNIQGNNNTITTGSQHDTITFSASTLSNGYYNTINSYGGDNILNVFSGYNTINLMDDNDNYVQLNCETSGNTINTYGSGTNTYDCCSYSSSIKESNTINGGSGINIFNIGQNSRGGDLIVNGANAIQNTFNITAPTVANTSLTGGAGDDVFNIDCDSFINNKLRGGGGNDTFNFIKATTNRDNIIMGGEGVNTCNDTSGNNFYIDVVDADTGVDMTNAAALDLAASTTATGTISIGGSTYNITNNENVAKTLIASVKDGTTYFTNAASITIEALDKSTSHNVNLKTGNSTYIAGDAGDTITINGTTLRDMTIYGGAGDDVMDLSIQTSNVYAGEGNNNIRVYGSNYNSITAGNGNNTVTTTLYMKSIELGNGNNTLNVKQNTGAVIVGNGTNDITASSSVALIKLGNGNNNTVTLKGDATIVAGTGSGNRFILNTGSEETWVRNNINILSQSNYILENNAGRDVHTNLVNGSVANGTLLKFNNGETKELTIGGKHYTVQNSTANMVSSGILGGPYSPDDNLFMYEENDDGSISFFGEGYTVTCNEEEEHNIVLYGANNKLIGGKYNDRIINYSTGETNILCDPSKNANAEGGNDYLELRQYPMYPSTGSFFLCNGDDTVVTNVQTQDGTLNYHIGNIYSGYKGTNTVTFNSQAIYQIQGGDNNITFNADSCIVSQNFINTSNNTYTINSNSCSINDSRGNSTFYINGNNNTIDGREGDDIFYINGTNNSVKGAVGNDNFYVSGSNNTVDGGVGDNYLLDSGTGNTISGMASDPTVGQRIFTALNQTATFTAVNGIEYKLTNIGNDGTGSNTNKILYRYDTNTHEIIFMGDNITIETVDTHGNENKVQFSGNNSKIIGSSGDDVLRITSGEDNLIDGGDGDDTLTVNYANNNINSGDGNDTINYNAATESSNITLGNGAKNVNLNQAFAGTVSTGISTNVDLELNINGENSDLILTTGSNSTLDTANFNINGNNSTFEYTGSLDTNTTVNARNANVTLGSGNDDVTVNGNGNTVNSGNGNDYLVVKGNNNTLNGDAGDDIFIVSGSNNDMTGGDGDDKFQIKKYAINNDVDGNGGTNKLLNYGGATSSRNVEDITPPSTTINFTVSDSGDDDILTIDIEYSLGDLEFDASSVESAVRSIDLIDKMLNETNSKRAYWATVQTRFEECAKANASKIINLSAAKSTIFDTDYTKEFANLVQAQILQQIGTSVLTQSRNLQAQTVLALIG